MARLVLLQLDPRADMVEEQAACVFFLRVVHYANAADFSAPCSTQ